MNKYLSLIFLYNKATYKRIIFISSVIPLSFLAIFMLRVGNPYEAEPYMIMECAFDGIFPVLIFIAANLFGMLLVIGSLSGRKSLKISYATTGYTIRRLRISPLASYFTMFAYYLVIIFIFWGVALLSLLIIGNIALNMAGATDIDIKVALGLLRTNLGHALLPIEHPVLISFNLLAIIAMAAECAKSCYLSWHNGTPAVGIVVVIVPTFLAWIDFLDNTYMLMAIVVIVLYAFASIGDVISREILPKGDPFKVNKYAGVMDMDSTEFDDNIYENQVNCIVDVDASVDSENALPHIYGKRKFNFNYLRCRYMPLGINLEKVNTLFGSCIAIGIIEHLIFYFRYLMNYNTINDSIKGISIAEGVKMPYFWDLQEYSYYGYVMGIILVLFVQAYWNYEYYNKKTKIVYVMKRLPDRSEYIKTIWGGPILQALMITVIMVAHTAIDICLYIFVTPDLALYSDYLMYLLPF